MRAGRGNRSCGCTGSMQDRGQRGRTRVALLLVAAVATLSLPAGCEAVLNPDGESGIPVTCGNGGSGSGTGDSGNAACSGTNSTGNATGDSSGDSGAVTHSTPVITARFSEDLIRGTAFKWLDGAYSSADLYKFGRGRVNVRVCGLDPSDPLVSLAVTVDGKEAVPLEHDPSELAGCEDRQFDLGISSLPEGTHVVDISATCAKASAAYRQETFRSLLNVTALTHVLGDTLFVGTFEYGLLTYALGADRLDPADDTATPLALRGPLHDFGATEGWGFPGDGNSVLALYWDQEAEGLWVGSLLDGLFFVRPAPDLSGSPVLSARFTLPLCGGDTYPCGEDRMPGDSGQTGLDLWTRIGNSITAIQGDGGTGVWLGTFEGLVHFDHGGTVAFPQDDIWTVFPSAGLYDANISRIAVDPAGRIWIASFDLADDEGDADMLAVLDPHGTPWYKADDEWGTFPDLAGVLSNKIYTLAIDAQGLVWIGTSEGLFVLDHAGTPMDPSDDQWTQRGMNDGLPDNDIALVVPRSDGSLWVGGMDVCEEGTGGGLALLVPDPFAPVNDKFPVTYTTDDGLLDADVSSLVELPDGPIVVGTFNVMGAASIAAKIGAYGETDLTGECGPGGQMDGPPPAVSGSDGLAVIDMKSTPGDKSDDTILNL